MSWQILQRWFNLPPEGIAEYFIANHGKKFWFAWDEGAEPDLYLQVCYYGQWIGHVQTISRKNHGLELSDIIVLPQFRYLRGQGVGSEMMKCLIKEARRRNVRSIWGVIIPDEYTTNEQLIKFYTKHGFEVSENQTGKHSILLKLNG